MTTAPRAPGQPDWGDLIDALVEAHGSLATVAERLAAERGHIDHLGSVERALRRLRARGGQPGGQWGARVLRTFGLPLSIEDRLRFMGAYHSRFVDLPVPLCVDLVGLWDRPPVNEGRTGRLWLGLARLNLAFRGRDLDEAAQSVEALVGETALDDGLRADLGWLALRMGHADLALAFCAPSATATVNLLACRHTAFARRGAMTEARAAALSLMNRLGAAPADTDAVAQASPVAGYRRFLDWRATHFLPPSGHWFQRAQVLAEAGQTEAAINSLEQAAAARDPSMVKIRTTPEFRSLAGSERFQLLWRAVGPDPGSGRTSPMGGNRREG